MSLSGLDSHLSWDRKEIDAETYPKVFEASDARKAESKAKTRLESEGQIRTEQRDEYIEVFRKFHGVLTSAHVMQFEGWTTKWKYLPASGQVRMVYIEPDGKMQWSLMKDLEATLGLRIAEGRHEAVDRLLRRVDERDPGLSRSFRRRAVAEGEASYRCPAKDNVVALLGEDGFKAHNEDFEAQTEGKRKRRRERSLLALDYFKPEDYQEVAGWGVREASSASNDMRELAASARQALRARGFQESRLLVLGADEATLVPELCRLVASAISGVYYEVQCEDAFEGGRHYYRRLVEVPGSDKFLGDRMCIFWRKDGAARGWNVGAIGPGLIGYAFQGEQTMDPCEVKGSWKLLKAD